MNFQVTARYFRFLITLAPFIYIYVILCGMDSVKFIHCCTVLKVKIASNYQSKIFFTIYLSTVFYFFLDLFHADKKETLSVNTNELTYLKEVMKWCKKNLATKTHKQTYPKIALVNQPEIKHLGYFDNNRNEIGINVARNKDVVELTNTFIHEYQHFLDSPDQVFNILYNDYTNRYGYSKNPYEVRARETANNHTNECIKNMITKGLIIKE